MGIGTFDVVIDGCFAALIFEEFDGVSIGCAHELIAIVDSIFLIVVDDELPICDVLRHSAGSFIS